MNNIRNIFLLALALLGGNTLSQASSSHTSDQNIRPGCFFSYPDNRICQTQNAASSKDTNATRRLSWHGFVNPHLFADSRQVVAGREDMMLFYPKPIEQDADGNDINATPALQLLSITARLNLTIQGPDVLGAHTKGFIEGDFTGSTNATINDLRLRHAYIDMQWKTGSLLMGQYWYPMVVQEVMPCTNPLNMGAPFHPYARYNQLRYTKHLGKMELVGVAAFELDNKSQGPDESAAVQPTTVNSTTLSTRSLIPELNLQLRYHGTRLFCGAAANLLTLRPRTYVLDTLGKKHQTTQRFFSPSFSLFARYDFAGWTLKSQTLLSDNLYEGCTLGGYIESWRLDGDTYSYSYKPWTYTTFWLDFGRSCGTWRPGIFLGCARNNYHTDNGEGDLTANETAFGRGFDISHLYRIQPRLVYWTDKGLSFQAEVEYTTAHYLIGNGAAGNSNHWADNMRYSLSAVYAF
jgi:hypothetical protein